MSGGARAGAIELDTTRCVQSSETDSVLLHEAGGVTTIELNRPQVLNAWNAHLGAELRAGLAHARRDAATRAIVITGSGRAFSSGVDLTDISSGETTDSGDPAVQKALNERYHPIIAAIREMPKPVIASVNGPAVGVGCSLALCCDLILAGAGAYFLLAFVNIGLAPDGGCSLFLPARVGGARASELALLGEPLSAERAHAWGLVNRIVPDERLAAETAALAARLAGGPTRSFAAIKRQLNNSVYRGLAEQLELEAAIQQQLAATADFREGVAAFNGKRTAHFTGR